MREETGGGFGARGELKRRKKKIMSVLKQKFLCVGYNWYSNIHKGYFALHLTLKALTLNILIRTILSKLSGRLVNMSCAVSAQQR